MKFLLTISFFTLVIASLSFVDAARKPTWGLRCAPFCSNGRQRAGARGPCINSCFAITCRGKPDILTYRPALMDQNRRLSGCAAQRTSPCTNTRLRYRGSGNSCDEYPIASTQQGGTGSILRCVAARENSSQGGQFRGYVSRNSVRPGDTFPFAVVLVPGTVPYCPGSTTGCNNDGFEFRFRNRAFSNAREIASDESLYEEATNGTEVNSSLAVFQTSGGHYVTALTDEENALNSTIWIDGDDGGEQTIVKQLDGKEIQALAAAPAPDATC